VSSCHVPTDIYCNDLLRYSPGVCQTLGKIILSNKTPTVLRIIAASEIFVNRDWKRVLLLFSLHLRFWSPGERRMSHGSNHVPCVPWAMVCGVPSSPVPVPAVSPAPHFNHPSPNLINIDFAQPIATNVANIRSCVLQARPLGSKLDSGPGIGPGRCFPDRSS
jgi:hypothetical protein